MPRRRKTPAPFRLSFGGTRKKLPAPSLKSAVKDARYWTSFGQLKVCIERRLPSGSYVKVGCAMRGKMKLER